MELVEWQEFSQKGSKHVSGQLDLDGTIDLNFSHPLQTARRAVNGFSPIAEYIPAVFGVSKSGVIMGYELVLEKYTRSLGSQKLDVINYSAKYLLRGTVRIADSRPRFYEFRVSLQGLSKWSRLPSFDFLSSGIKVSSPDYLKDFTFENTQNGWGVRLSESITAESFDFMTNEAILRREPSLVFNFRKAVSVQEFVDNWLTPLEVFFSISYGMHAPGTVKVSRKTPRSTSKNLHNNDWLLVLPTPATPKVSKLANPITSGKAGFDLLCSFLSRDNKSTAHILDAYLDYQTQPPKKPENRIPILLSLVESLEVSLNTSPSHQSKRSKSREIFPFAIRNLNSNLGHPVPSPARFQNWPKAIGRVRNIIIHGLPERANLLNHPQGINVAVRILEVLVNLAFLKLFGLTNQNISSIAMPKGEASTSNYLSMRMPVDFKPLKEIYLAVAK